ncbi:DUF952 domain-containing protein [Temperatibacter marinus]|uniref:DUF952 domain-containing protein n=1 Tax=Temperatibacter marinus TaxID=1456591 RepID=A0AA52EF83_9PROT|nr:DUF952 domain-containing protein [Temperatibacter marinus]WND03691.1 DUF952 domain-containing protein [Temperatibacter marinus]
MNSAFIYKILLIPEYEEALHHGRLIGAPIDIEDGYIHFSTHEQTQETLQKHFKSRGDVVILKVSVSALKDEFLRFEKSRNDALFPHYYTIMAMDAVVSTWSVPMQADGSHHIDNIDEFTKKGPEDD